MPSDDLSAWVREELLAHLESPDPVSAVLSPQLREAAGRGEIQIHAALLKLLARIEMSEAEARTHWEAISAHRADLCRRLGRDPGVWVSSADYFMTNRAGALLRPKVVEGTLLDRAERAAVADPLTGLFNFRHFRALLRAECRRAERHSLDFSLVLLDPDGLGELNARSGRPAGDAALKGIAGIIRARSRGVDLASRYPGGGFAVLLPGTRRLGAFVASDRIRSAAADHFLRRPLGDRCFPLTLSGGVAACPPDGTDAEGLLEQAARALALAKARGKNNVVIYHAEKRGGVRFRPGGWSLRVRAFRAESQPAEILRARDLSDSGALFESPHPLDLGEELELRFPRLDPEPDLIVPAKVTRFGDPQAAGHAVGFHFLVERPDVREALNGFLSGLRRQGIE